MEEPKPVPLFGAKLEGSDLFDVQEAAALTGISANRLYEFHTYGPNVGSRCLWERNEKGWREECFALAHARNKPTITRRRSMSETTRENLEDQLECERAAIEEQVAQMEAQHAGLPPMLSWEDLQNTEVVAEAAQEQAKRGLLPQMIRAGQRRLKELEKQRLENGLDELREELSQAFEKREELQAQLAQTQQEAGQAQGEYHHYLMKVQSREKRIKDIDREIQNLEGGR